MTAILNPKIAGLLALFVLVLYYLSMPLMQMAADAGVSAHAVERHGTAALSAQECKSSTNMKIFHNAATNRSGIVCLMADGHWGVVITDEVGREITSFVKEKMKTFEQVLKYMRNAGYELVQ